MSFLKGIRLRGFKTFARPTELVLEPGVTVIIGPNGSGKSNLADAVLWALGEQSPGALRGKGMQDVLFAGSKGHQPTAAAEVSLLFDNSLGEFPGGYQEVEIARRVVREGTSDYFINGSSCRLLDLQELCSAVGLGREMHSVISQGKVEELLNSSPVARRALIEEAAGLSLYKKRRDRALAKMDRVTSDLERVGDVERELRVTLRPLKQQASAAQKHVELSEAAAECQALLSIRSICMATREGSQLEEARERLQATRARCERELELLRAQRGEEEAAFARALADREQQAAVFHRVQSDAARLSERLAELRQRHVRLETDLSRTRRRREGAESEWADARARLSAISNLPQSAEARLEIVRRAAERVSGELSRERPRLQEMQAKEEVRKDAILEWESRRSRARQRLELLGRERTEMERRASEARERASAAGRTLQDLTDELTFARDDRAEAEARLEVAADSVRRAGAELARMRAAMSQSRDRLHRQEELVASLESRVRVLEGVILRRDGLPAAAVDLLAGKEGSRLLVEILQVAPGFEEAVAAALGPLADAVVVEEEAGRGLLADASGPLETIGTARSSGGNGHDSRRTSVSGGGMDFPVDLWDVVAAPAEVADCLQRLLPPTTLVDSLESWEREHGGPPGDRRLVSAEGEVLTYGVHAAKRRSVGSEAILRARRESDECRGALEKALEEADRIRREAASLDEAAAEAQKEREGLERVVAEAKRVTGRLAEAEQTLRNRAEQAERAKDGAAAEAARLEEIQTGFAEEERELERDLEESEGRLSDEREALRSGREEEEGLRRRVAFLERKRSQAAVLETRLREQLRARRQEAEFLTGQAATAETSVSRLRRREDGLLSAVPAVVGLAEVVEGIARRVAEVAARVEGRAEESRRTSAQFGDVLRELADREAALQREAASAGEELAETQVRLAQVMERLRQEQERLEELKRKHLSPRTVTAEAAEAADSEKVIARLADLQEKKERLGPVNPLADRECQEVMERLSFIGEQRRDLEASLAELSKVIEDLELHISTVFADFFAKVRENFREMVTTLFPGGRGELRLEEARAQEADEEQEGDVSEPAVGGRKRPVTGINLEIKLPHKAPRSLTLLSGGEKALTAIAFLFALFLAKPCPFYILDEVEAALDDLNIGRFLSLLTRYQERTQFLVVTHQRRTMEIADTLYGVTMGEDGVSRVLSRRLDQRRGQALRASS